MVRYIIYVVSVCCLCMTAYGLHALRIVGVMTGTSCDGLDAACIEISEHAWKPVWFVSRPYPISLRQRVLALQHPHTPITLKELLLLDRDLGLWYAQQLADIIHQQGSVDVIALHGQTVAHHPDAQLTLQLGNAAMVAAHTGCTVVYNFRQGDQAAGGQGAPLVPLFHAALATRLPDGNQGIAIHNSGGISNLTYIAPDGEIIAFDTGPGNMLIDGAVSALTSGTETFDRDGRIAAQGRVDTTILSQLLEHTFFAQVPPKSTGRDDFVVAEFLRHFEKINSDVVATATMLTVESIARAYEHWIIGRGLPLQTIYMCGGGAYNKTVMRWLQERLPQVRVITLESMGFNNQAIEAQAFAWLGYKSFQGEALGGSWTGAQRYGPPGSIIPGQNFKMLQNLLLHEEKR